MFKCLFFPTGGTCIRTLTATINADLDDACVWPLDLQLSEWFPLGQSHVRITHVPFTDHPLRNELVVFFSSDQVSSLPNRSLAKLYGIHWMGNVIVLKCAKGDPLQVIQMDWGDKKIVDVVVALYVYINPVTFLLYNLPSYPIHSWLRTRIVKLIEDYHHLSWWYVSRTVSNLIIC